MNYLKSLPKSSKHKKKKVSLTTSRVEIEDPTESAEDPRDPWRIFRIMTEFVMGFDFLKQFTKAATIFGSARFDESHPSYKETQKLASMLSKEGFAIMTGGGPGIMEAANRGANDAGGHSVGISIKIPTEQGTNQYANKSTEYKYFFTRKVMLVYASQMYVFFPGGFGTLDELFELVTLVKTHKIQPVPIILVDKKFWTPLLAWIDETLVKQYNTVTEAETEYYILVDTPEEAMEKIKELLNHDDKTIQHPGKEIRATKPNSKKRS